MNLTESITPKSDQLNSEDLLASDRVFTVAEVRAGTDEQPVHIHTQEMPGRPFKPSKTVRRLLVAAWGPDSAVYAGRRMRLYRDPEVRFGGQAIGGIRLSHVSDITAPIKVALATTRGKRAMFTVLPLEDAPSPPPIDVGSITDEAELKALWQTRPDLHDAIKARVNELKEEQ